MEKASAIKGVSYKALLCRASSATPIHLCCAAAAGPPRQRARLHVSAAGNRQQSLSYGTSFALICLYSSRRWQHKAVFVQL